MSVNLTLQSSEYDVVFFVLRRLSDGYVGVLNLDTIVFEVLGQLSTARLEEIRIQMNDLGLGLFGWNSGTVEAGQVSIPDGRYGVVYWGQVGAAALVEIVSQELVVEGGCEVDSSSPVVTQPKNAFVEVPPYDQASGIRI